jgi:hypothetical protein
MFEFTIAQIVISKLYFLHHFQAGNKPMSQRHVEDPYNPSKHGMVVVPTKI